MIPNKGARILYIDIEISPTVSYVWPGEMWKARVTADKVLEDTFIMSFAAVWNDSDEVIYRDAQTKRSQKRMLVELHRLMDEADIVVVQNGKAFDVPRIKSELIIHGFRPFSPIKVVDTFLEARKQFAFTFNSLDHLGRVLKCSITKGKHRQFPGLTLWKECLKGNREAWAEMQFYNIDDTLLLRQVYRKLRPWIQKHPNLGVYVEGENHVCPKCGGEVARRGYYYTQVGVYAKYQCKNLKECGGYSHGRLLLSNARHRRRQLSN